MSLSEVSSAEPAIPSRRRQPKDHMRAAAKSSLGSAEEYYSVQAAIAESLMNLAESVRLQNEVLVALLGELQKKTVIRYEFKNGAGEVLSSDGR